MLTVVSSRTQILNLYLKLVQTCNLKVFRGLSEGKNNKEFQNQYYLNLNNKICSYLQGMSR